MKRRRFTLAVAVLGLTVVFGWTSRASAQADPLPSWNDTPAKQAIIAFVGRITSVGGPDFRGATRPYRHVRQ